MIKKLNTVLTIKIKNFPDYGITTEGKIFNYKTLKPLKYKIDKQGYCHVGLYKNGKRSFFLVH